MTLVNNVSIQDKFSCCYSLAFSIIYTILEYFLSVCMSVCTHFSQKVFNVQQKMKHHNIRCGQAEELQVSFFLKIQDGRQKSKMAAKISHFCDFLKKY